MRVRQKEANAVHQRQHRAGVIAHLCDIKTEVADLKQAIADLASAIQPKKEQHHEQRPHPSA